MKKFVGVQQIHNGKWVVTNKGSILDGAPHNEEWQAQLQAHHYRHAPSLFSKLGFKKREGGEYFARPFWGITASIVKIGKQWSAVVTVDDQIMDSRCELFKTREAACKFVSGFGKGMVMTTNILNPKSGQFPISRASKGGCCDPGTERYHCM